MSVQVTEIGQQDYEREVLASGGAVVVDFYSTECPPCEALAPRLEAVATEFAGRARFLKVFRQGNRELAARLGVMSSPTLVFFKDGEERGARLMGGGIGKAALRERVEELVAPAEPSR
jgi:thiol-disulfide isomerase/thioredoxin